MTKKIIVCYKSVIDVEIFSCVENYIGYVGYPWQDLIDDKDVYEEDGRVFNFYIEKEYNLNYNIGGQDVDKMNKYMMNYINSFDLILEEKSEHSSQDLIECIVNFRGVTI